MDEKQNRHDNIQERETGKKMPESNVHGNREPGEKCSETAIAKKETQDMHNGVPVNPEPLNNNIEEHELEEGVKARENPEENRRRKLILENERLSIDYRKAEFLFCLIYTVKHRTKWQK